jgi:hypothetical protein
MCLLLLVQSALSEQAITQTSFPEVQNGNLHLGGKSVCCRPFVVAEDRHRNINAFVYAVPDRLCGLVVRVPCC